jgi:hypothetical protein
MRARYTWHLRPPFDQEFDRSHWWKNEPQIDPAPAAALYELARRHPRVGELRSRLHHAGWYGQELRAPLVGAAKERMASHAFDDLGQEPEALHCLCLIGLKTWPTLGWRYQEYWMASAGNIKGVDCRDDLERCYSVTDAAMCDVILQRGRALKVPRKAFQAWVSPSSIGPGESEVVPVDIKAFQRSVEIIGKHLCETPISAAEIEPAIAEVAVGAEHQGHWIIAVASDLAQDEAELLMGKVYREHRLRREEALGAGKQRPRPKQWLKLISEFENAETSSGGTNASGFNPYRAIMDSIRFGSSQELASKLVPPK